MLWEDRKGEDVRVVLSIASMDAEGPTSDGLSFDRPTNTPFGSPGRPAGRKKRHRRMAKARCPRPRRADATLGCAFAHRLRERTAAPLGVFLQAGGMIVQGPAERVLDLEPRSSDERQFERL